MTAGCRARNRDIYPQTQIIAVCTVNVERISNPELKAAIKCVHEYDCKVI